MDPAPSRPPPRPRGELSGFTLLQVTPALGAGGVEQTTLDIAGAVASRGGRALVASEGGRLEHDLEARGGALLRLPMASKNPVAMAAAGRALAAAIVREDVDVVHARSRAPAFPALWAARRTGRSFVTTYHGVYNFRSPLKRWYNAVMTRGDLVIANSDYTRRHILATHRTAPERVVAIPRGIDLRRFDPAAVTRERLQGMRRGWRLAPEDARPVILLAGRLTRWKGQALAIEALARLAAEGTPAVLVLAGDDQGRAGYGAALRALAASRGVAEAVRFAGHVDDMPAAYLAADVALSASLEPEAFGRTAVEPQAMGRAVVAARHGATEETVVDGHTGLLAAPGDAAAFAGALARLIALGPEGRAALGAQGRARAKALYSLEAMVALTLAVYARLRTRAA